MTDRKCPFCGSVNSVWRGYRYNDSGKKRMKLCKKCGKKYTPNDGFLRMRFKPSTIRKAVNLYKKGFSSAEVVLRMKREGVKVSRWTVICWVRRYSKMAVR